MAHFRLCGPGSPRLQRHGLTVGELSAYGQRMPSGVGHALGGVIVELLAHEGWEGQAGVTDVPRRSPNWQQLGWLAFAGCAPDLDFFWGRHAAETHSIGAALLVGGAVFAISRGRQARLAICVTLAWLSHVLFDWLGSDTTPPIGVMALWPFSSEYYFAYAYIFDSISRRYWLPGFWMHNLMAVVREVAILGPIVAGLWLWRVRRGWSSDPPAS